MTFDSTGLIGPQSAHAERLFDSLNTNGFALDCSETGTGKTYCAAAIARASAPRPIVLIAPKTVLRTWMKIFTVYGVKPKLVINYELLARGRTKWMKFIKQADPERPHVPNATEKLPNFRLPADALVILDEGHRCKGLDTTNSQMLVNLVVQKYRVLVCSATAAVSPLDMKALGFLLQLHSLHDFPDFCRLHGAQWTGRWGSLSFSMDDPAAKVGMQALHNYLFNVRKCASRMVREDFGNLFPESHVVADVFDLGSNEAKVQTVYLDMEREIAQLEERCANYREHIFAILMAARRKAEMLKVPLFVEMVEDLFDEGKSVVLFCNFDDTIEAVAGRLLRLKKYKDQIVFVRGGQSSNDRETAIAEFQADTKRIAIVNTAAGGVAISLHDLNGKFPRASIISPNWSAMQMLQCIGRIWRQGGKTKSYQRIVYAARTIEEQICRRVSEKITSLNTLNDGELAESVRWV
jgi:hypothetical protein